MKIKYIFIILIVIAILGGYYRFIYRPQKIFSECKSRMIDYSMAIGQKASDLYENCLKENGLKR